VSNQPGILALSLDAERLMKKHHGDTHHAERFWPNEVATNSTKRKVFHGCWMRYVKNFSPIVAVTLEKERVKEQLRISLNEM
jgi:hypothetical protein